MIPSHRWYRCAGKWERRPVGRGERRRLGRELRDIGMARVAASTQRWSELAYDAAIAVAERLRYWTSDDVWDQLARWGVPEPPPGKRVAMGPLITRLRNDGIMKETNERVTTKRPQAHLRPIVVYESLIYRGDV